MNEYEETKLFELIKKGSFNEKNCFEWKGPFSKDGYGVTSFVINKKKQTIRCHRLIYLLLRVKIPKGMLICHACDNPKCFNICHLFTGTAKDNCQDRERKGRSKDGRGSKSGTSKLTERDVLLIRKLHSENVKTAEIMKIFGISQSHVSRLVRRQEWKHI